MVVPVVVVVKRLPTLPRSQPVKSLLSFVVVLVLEFWGMAGVAVAVGKTDAVKRRMFCAENPGIEHEHDNEHDLRFKRHYAWAW
ncbi:MAG: hypothetical protein QOG92_220 [Verrucomicrobiota bacterium]|nr:hypothetical protein [Verrucomicrobiota bacterium]